MMRYNKYSKFFTLFLVFVLLSGCANYEYTQTISEDGESTLELLIDYRTTIQEDADKEGKTYGIKMKEFAKQRERECNGLIGTNPELTCSVKNSILRISMDLVEGEHYTFEKIDSIPDYIYNIEINKIPNLNLINDISGIEEIDLRGNLSNEEKGKLALAEKLELELYYNLVVPGEVVEAYSGEVEGEIEGNSIRFDLLEIGNDPSPIVIKSKIVNEFYLNLLMGIGLTVFLIFIYLIFFKHNRVEKED